MATSIKSQIAQRLEGVRARIREAELRYGRSAGSVALLAVSKTRPVEDLEQALAAGQRAFGENYLQEAMGKIEALNGRGCEWHFIGPVQANKTRQIAEHFQWVHSVDRLKVARRLSEQRPGGLPPLEVCLQVNVSGEASKSGIEPAALDALATAVAALPRLRLRGLMTIPAPTPDFDRQRLMLARLRRARERLQGTGIALDTLSMGMSDDLEAAVAEGATLVRIGTAIFGPRPAPDTPPRAH